MMTSETAALLCHADATVHFATWLPSVESPHEASQCLDSSRRPAISGQNAEYMCIGIEPGN